MTLHLMFLSVCAGCAVPMWLQLLWVEICELGTARHRLHHKAVAAAVVGYSAGHAVSAK